MNDINKIQQDIRQDLEKEGLGDFTTLTNNFIKILNDALEKKQAEINYWKTKAYILFQYQNIARLECPKHDTHIERSFDPWEAINNKKCKTCEAQERINPNWKK